MKQSFPPRRFNLRRAPPRPAARRYQPILQFRTSQCFYPEAEACAEKADIGMTQEALSSLQTLGAQLRAKLLELPEYRALTVIERTIQELSEIMNPSMTPSSDRAAPADPANALVGALQRADAAPAIVGSSQSRMAKAIAETIAAKAAPFNAPAGAAPQLGQAFNTAS
jgi:hypothetical protein